VLARSQTRGPVDLTAGELRRAVARARAGLARLGVGRGDRVVAYMPNIPETLVAFLATASLGAVWASCAPEFGTRSVLDRFSQIDPKVLLTIDGYRYGAKAIDRRAEVAAIRGGLPGLAATVAVPYLDAEGGAAAVPGAMAWAELLSEDGPLDYEAVPFDHPLYAVAPGRGDGNDVLRRQRPLPHGLPPGRARAGQDLRPLPGAGRRVDRSTAAAGGLPVGLRGGHHRRAAQLGQRGDRRVLSIRGCMPPAARAAAPQRRPGA